MDTAPSQVELSSAKTALGNDLLQTFFGLILYGLAVHQSYRYFRLFPSDSRFIRILVVVDMTLQTVHTVFGMHSCYYLMVTHFFTPTTGVWSLNSISVVSSAIVLVSQMQVQVAASFCRVDSDVLLTSFFARRVYLLGGLYRALVAFAVLLLIGEIVLCIAAAYLSFTSNIHVDMLWKLPQILRDLVVSALAVPFIADMMFTSALITVLHSSRAGVKKTESNMDLFTIYIVNTGVLHCIFNALAFFVSLGTTATTISDSPYLIFSTIAQRLYAISLLSALNCRDPNRSVVVFNPSSNPNVFRFAQQRAEAETWNVPQVSGERTPTSIQIGVAHEMEGRKWDFSTSSMTGSNADKESY
ncbi:hypothetical protein GSI_09357 [Ganoderma sinense ZZ0214-1]|uniref:DUF6534 domain-containing protein n=1 Tax=Ganoderma sinense ZZ0214-1 TaxID=1077348 RepID=A0A2G8S6A5_9APHY|nr:hypothetical protein GSI_09357 [Ganoderma sinense ZZ0214-1]